MKNLLLLATLAFVVVGCDDPTPVPSSYYMTKSGVSASLSTIVYDGHKIVVGTSNIANGGVSMMHHPDCECKK